MRVLRFRVFNIYERRMSSSFSLNQAIEHTNHEGVRDYHRVMEFTGCLDNKGTEIYEGDILKASVDPGSADGLQEVWFAEGAFWRGRHGQGTILGTDNNDWEVVGNVWEDPQLLNDASVVAPLHSSDASR
jgi:hypothetical protein